MKRIDRLVEGYLLQKKDLYFTIRRVSNLLKNNNNFYTFTLSLLIIRVK